MCSDATPFWSSPWPFWFSPLQSHPAATPPPSLRPREPLSSSDLTLASILRLDESVICCGATSGLFGARYHGPHPRPEPLRPTIGLDAVPLAPLPPTPILFDGPHPLPPTFSFLSSIHKSSTRKSSNVIPPTTHRPRPPFGTRHPQRARPPLATLLVDRVHHARQALARNL
ncbi:hypothetical protein C8R46DRAFT_1294157 [Mycena filopes]|nr:hypothetical protein C8R46DRAFT_1294157 [Mycena filopes]